MVIISMGWMLAAPGTGFSSGTCAIETDQASVRRSAPISFKDMSPSQIDMVVDFSRMSEAAYHDSFKAFIGTTGITWERIAHTDFEKESQWFMKLNTSGLKWDLFEGRSPNGERVRVVAFAGTDVKLNGRDFLTDAYQLLALPAQYWEALHITRRIVDATAREPGVKLYFTGHSLGGGLAQFMALVSKMQAIVFNPAGLGLMARELERSIPQAYQEAANLNILNIGMKGEFVHTFGLQLGQAVEVAPPPGVSRDPLTLHGQGLMVKTVTHEWEQVKANTILKELSLPSLNKPIGGVSIDPEVSFVPANLGETRERILRGMKK